MYLDGALADLGQAKDWQLSKDDGMETGLRGDDLVAGFPLARTL